MNAEGFTRSRSRKYAVSGRGSNAVDSLEDAWEMLRKIETTIPPAVLTFVDSRSRGWVLGYFAHATWKKRQGAAHEIAISPILIGHPAELVATMLHEAAHAILWDTGKHGGVGSTRYYHTTLFRDQCRKLGLACEFLNTRYGWTVTSWPASGIPNHYKPIVQYLRGALPAGIGGKVVKMTGKRLPRTGHTMLVCGCPDGTRTIYVKKSVLEAGGVTCTFCKKAFRLPSA